MQTTLGRGTLGRVTLLNSHSVHSALPSRRSIATFPTPRNASSSSLDGLAQLLSRRSKARLYQSGQQNGNASHRTTADPESSLLAPRWLPASYPRFQSEREREEFIQDLLARVREINRNAAQPRSSYQTPILRPVWAERFLRARMADIGARNVKWTAVRRRQNEGQDLVQVEYRPSVLSLAGLKSHKKPKLCSEAPAVSTKDDAFLGKLKAQRVLETDTFCQLTATQQQTLMHATRQLLSKHYQQSAAHDLAVLYQHRRALVFLMRTCAAADRWDIQQELKEHWEQGVMTEALLSETKRQQDSRWWAEQMISLQIANGRLKEAVQALQAAKENPAVSLTHRMLQPILQHLYRTAQTEPNHGPLMWSLVQLCRNAGLEPSSAILNQILRTNLRLAQTAAPNAQHVVQSVVPLLLSRHPVPTAETFCNLLRMCQSHADMEQVWKRVLQLPSRTATTRILAQDAFQVALAKTAFRVHSSAVGTSSAQSSYWKSPAARAFSWLYRLEDRLAGQAVSLSAVRTMAILMARHGRSLDAVAIPWLHRYPESMTPKLVVRLLDYTAPKSIPSPIMTTTTAEERHRRRKQIHSLLTSLPLSTFASKEKARLAYHFGACGDSRSVWSLFRSATELDPSPLLYLPAFQQLGTHELVELLQQCPMDSPHVPAICRSILDSLPSQRAAKCGFLPQVQPSALHTIRSPLHLVLQRWAQCPTSQTKDMELALQEWMSRLRPQRNTEADRKDDHSWNQEWMQIAEDLEQERCMIAQT